MPFFKHLSISGHIYMLGVTEPEKEAPAVLGIKGEVSEQEINIHDLNNQKGAQGIM